MVKTALPVQGARGSVGELRSHMLCSVWGGVGWERQKKEVNEKKPVRPLL